MSILEDLYTGKISPMENIVPDNPAYRSTSTKVGDMREYFLQKLSDEDCEKFRPWNQLIQEVYYMEGYENFSYGFRLAVWLLMEAMKEYNPSEQ